MNKTACRSGRSTQLIPASRAGRTLGADRGQRVCAGIVLLATSLVFCGCVAESNRPWRIGPIGKIEYARQASKFRGPLVEVQWFTPPADGPVATEPTGRMDAWVRMRDVTYASETPASKTVDGWTLGERRGNQTVTTLRANRTYDFEYLVPHRPDALLNIQMEAHDPVAGWAGKFVRHSNIVIDPASRLSVNARSSILSDADIDRVLAGDVVEKVVFVADQAAIDRRLDMIEQEMRRIRDLETRLDGQLEYWTARRTERRWNALYGEDYGTDVPAMHLVWLQMLLGPETYHRMRYSDADDMVQTYKESLARLALPKERLREEQGALRALLASAKIVQRRSGMVLATLDMTRRFHDARDEVRELRDTLGDPVHEWTDPYGYSPRSLLQVLLAPPRFPYNRPPLRTRTGQAELREPIGELVLTMRVGPRALYPLKAADELWAGRLPH